ncbi:WD40-repeat-containing domain protein [Trametes maxima]|nr:WD40-repeat-containing domain protein [Trametes maxima]
MAAILTTTNLTILEHSSLKHPPSVASPTCSLPAPPSSVFWSAESGTIFLASANGSLHQYDVASTTLQDLSLSGRASTEPCVSLLSKDRGSTIIYGQGQQIVVLSTSTGKPANTFDTHKAPVTSLSLSNDASLLASTSAHAIHVHNLTLASHTALRGIPSGAGSISTCAFHPHSRTRLLVGLGSQLLVYDTTRPSGPAKTIEIDKEKKNLGPIVAVSCSPFSKTLVAVACSGGMVALVDLEKEKGLFRMVPMPAPVTCLSFSAEGAAVYAGTENGKFLLLDLRALDKPPKSITVGENGDRVVALCVQRKLKPGEAVAKPVASTAASTGTSKPLVQRDVNKVAVSARAAGGKEPAKKTLDKDPGKAPLKPARTRAAPGISAATGSATTPRRTTTRTASTSGLANVQTGRTASSSRPAGGAGGPRSPVAGRPPIATEAPKRAFSPPRSPVTLADKKDEADSGDLSVGIEQLLALPKAKEPAVPSAVAEAASAAAPPRAPSALSRTSSRSQASESTRIRTHAKIEPASQAPTNESISTAGPRLRAGSSASLARRASKASIRSALGATNSTSTSTSPVRGQSRRVSGSTISRSRSRTASPDLPDINDGGPVTPIPAYKMKGKERAGAAGGVLGLGSPEVDAWVKAGEGRDARREGRRVGFAGESDEEGDGDGGGLGDARQGESDEEVEYERNNERGPRRTRAELAMQVSPRRSFPGPSSTAAVGASASASSRWAPVPSPLRHPPAAPASPQARAAQDMLQALLRDALHDFRAETKAEIVGLHLDLLRMGSGWRSEMREAVGGIGEELRALREENRRLREENERLRRGY